MSRVVIVTGCSGGIGLAIAVAFARAGDQVIATVRDPDRSGELPAAAAAAGVELDIAGLDVTDDGSVSSGVAAVFDRFGRIDVLVNNAGALFPGTLEELEIGDLERSLDVNYLGTARTTKAVLPAMREAGRGHLIAISSIAGVLGQPFNDAYCASKFAVEGLYESLHPVAGAFGVHVSLVEPGPVIGRFADRSEGVTTRAPSGPLAELGQRFASVTAAGYEGAQSPDDVAEMVVEVSHADPPALRYQTSDLVTRLVGRKLADLDGSRVTRLTGSWLH